MLVYIYDKRTSKKKETVKGVLGVVSKGDRFCLHTEDGLKEVEKKNIKLVVYGF